MFFFEHLDVLRPCHSSLQYIIKWEAIKYIQLIHQYRLSYEIQYINEGDQTQD